MYAVVPLLPPLSPPGEDKLWLQAGATAYPGTIYGLPTWPLATPIYVSNLGYCYNDHHYCSQASACWARRGPREHLAMKGGILLKFLVGT